MYGHIRDDNTVGQLYETMPAPDTYHPDYIARIKLLPDGVTSGWRYDPDTDEFLPPLPRPEPQPTLDEALEALRILTGGADGELDTIISNNT